MTAPTGEVSAPFTSLHLLLGIAALVTIMLGLILVQGFFIALAKLDRRQTMLLLYPLYIYALPAYYYASKWVGRTLPNQAFLVAVMQTISSFLLISLINLIWLELPFVHNLTDVYILVSCLAVSILGAAQGKKKASVVSQRT